MTTVEQLIEEGKPLVISFKDNYGKYYHVKKTFDSVEHYENFIDQQMKLKSWKEIGTNEYVPKD